MRIEMRDDKIIIQEMDKIFREEGNSDKVDINRFIGIFDEYVKEKEKEVIKDNKYPDRLKNIDKIKEEINSFFNSYYNFPTDEEIKRWNNSFKNFLNYLTSLEKQEEEKSEDTKRILGEVEIDYDKLTPSQMKIIKIIKENPNMPQRELAKLANTSLFTINNLKKKYVI